MKKKEFEKFDTQRESDRVEDIVEEYGKEPDFSEFNDEKFANWDWDKIFKYLNIREGAIKRISNYEAEYFQNNWNWAEFFKNLKLREREMENYGCPNLSIYESSFEGEADDYDSNSVRDEDSLEEPAVEKCYLRYDFHDEGGSFFGGETTPIFDFNDNPSSELEEKLSKSCEELLKTDEEWNYDITQEDISIEPIDFEAEEKFWLDSEEINDNIEINESEDLGDFEGVDLENEEKKFWLTSDGIEVKSVFHGIKNWLEGQYLEKAIEDHLESEKLKETTQLKYVDKLINNLNNTNDSCVNYYEGNFGCVEYSAEVSKDSSTNKHEKSAKTFDINHSADLGYLIDALNDPEEMVMLSAVEALGKTGDERALNQLIELLNETKSPKVQAKILEALNEIGKQMKEKYHKEFCKEFHKTIDFINLCHLNTKFDLKKNIYLIWMNLTQGTSSNTRFSMLMESFDKVIKILNSNIYPIYPPNYLDKDAEYDWISISEDNYINHDNFVEAKEQMERGIKIYSEYFKEARENIMKFTHYSEEIEVWSTADKVIKQFYLLPINISFPCADLYKDDDFGYEDSFTNLNTYKVSHTPSSRRRKSLIDRIIDENDEYMDDIISGLYGRR